PRERYVLWCPQLLQPLQKATWTTRWRERSTEPVKCLKDFFMTLFSRPTSG
ncbi:hypothetical protein M9458_030756, partial [Cirrhinus mrigala]